MEVTWVGLWMTVFVFFTGTYREVVCAELYSETDDIVLLNTRTFDQIILGKQYAWLVEFYSSWCGHCIRYAPKYKQLAADIKGWQPLVTVAAVDCAAEENTPVCRDYKITQYPTLTWFPAHSTGPISGIAIEEFDTAVNARHSVIKLLESNFDSTESSLNSQRVHDLLAPLGKMEDVFHFGTNDTLHYAVIAESTNSFTGREVILDMAYSEQLVVRRIHDASVQKAVLFVVSGASKSHLKPVIIPQKRKDFARYLQALLLSVNETASVQSTVVGVRQQVSGSQQSNTRDVTVHQQDLESGLHYSLRHEIALNGVIEDERLTVLKGYVESLAKFLPVQRPIATFLRNLHLWLNEQQSITGIQWLNRINITQADDARLPSVTRWTGCRGSEERFRGYPCSLWTTFHTLVVSAAEAKDPSVDARQVLLHVRGYVKHFFGCRECSQNFMRGAVHIEQRVFNDDDAIMFLWRSHNKANWNLRGDASEDPHHPKVQFPSVAQCPACHVTASNGTDLWNEPEVLQFLRTMYSRKGVVMDSQQLLVANDPPLGFTGILKSFARQHDRFDGVMSLTALDISLCFVFYIICALVLIALYVRFCRSRRVAAVVNLFQSFNA